DGQTGAEPCNSRNAPALCQAGRVEKPVEGQLITIARDEVMLHIPRRDPAAAAGIEGVDLFAHVRALIDGLAVRVTDQKLAATSRVSEVGLQSIVVGVRYGFLCSHRSI